MPISLAPGLHESLITEATATALAELEASGRAVERTTQQLDWVDDALARHVASQVRGALAGLGGDVDARAALVERVLGALDPGLLPGAAPHPTRQALTWVGPVQPGLTTPKPPERPEHGLVHPSLLFNGAQDVSLVHELQRELASADSVDAIVSFLRWSGLRLLRPQLQDFIERGGEFRLVTSTYVGATEARAVHALTQMGARVRVAYEEQGTRLHAKAWLFRRESGLSTAYIGSSNLSHSALTDGAEWNVRVTERVTPAVLERFSQAFVQLWTATAPDFTESDADRGRLQGSLRRARREDPDASTPLLLVDVAPRAHQERVLDALAAERAHGHVRNLVVSATGTGKTWVAAFDYARLRREGGVKTLLFVAHRKEILQQTRLVFRTVLRDPNFGELLVDGHVPERGHHVFASVQSLRGARLSALAPERYDMVVVDEFHHAAAPTYTALLERVEPKVLLGLTATPERADGRSILGWFDQRVASEIRLWDALDEGLLVPFHYFGVFDPGSAERAWKRGRLDLGVLDGLYGADDIRARKVVDAVARYIGDPQRMRALGFCVGVGHAMRMARAFNEAGLPSLAVHGGTPRAERSAALRALRDGSVRVLFTVDLFNEGVDIPEADTVLMLRPTQSATIFLQQLGRGLRRHVDKPQLTVLDFVGHVHADFRFDVRYQALLGGARRQVFEAIGRGFPRLPPGCAIQLEEQARELVLASLKRQLRSGGWRRLTEDLARLGAETTLADFLMHSGAELEDIFVPASARSWSALRRAAGFERRAELTGEAKLRKSVARMLHVDDDERVDTWVRWLCASVAPRLSSLSPRGRSLATMLVAALGDGRRLVTEHQDELDRLWCFDVIREEMVALLRLLQDRVRHVTTALADAPIAVHGTYTRAELVAAWGAVAKGRLRASREGVLYVEGRETDLLFINLDKSDDTFTPSIRYADYPLGPRRFHWESQNHTHADTPVGRRYVRGESRVILFVRERPKNARGQSNPLTCLGPARCVKHGGGRPMQIVWELDHAMPAWVLQQGRALGLGA
jgi:superfamily II DNA or RNA helicase/HKD family nuclease